MTRKIVKRSIFFASPSPDLPLNAWNFTEKISMAPSDSDRIPSAQKSWKISRLRVFPFFQWEKKLSFVIIEVHAWRTIFKKISSKVDFFKKKLNRAIFSFFFNTCTVKNLSNTAFNQDKWFQNILYSILRLWYFNKI